jgi:tetratricopeptide (TPR) repeat protein
MKFLTKVLILLLLAALIGIPPLIAGYANLSLAQAASNDTDASLHYETAAKFLFWRSDLYEKAGLLAHNEPVRQISLLTTARQKGSLSPTAQVTIGDAYLASHQIDPAISEWEDLLKRKQEIIRVAPRLAQVYHSRQQYTTEADLLKQWLDVDRHNPDASERLGRLLAATAAPEAEPLLNQAASASPQAATRLENLISALNSPNTDIAYRLVSCGQALARLDEWPLAEQAFTRAVDANPAYAYAWAWLGLSRQHNNTPNAQQAMDQALKLDQRSPAVRAMFGTYLQQDGKVEQARAQFSTATQLEQSNPAWWLALAGASAQSDLSAALNAYIQAVNLAPDQVVYWYALAAFCVEQNSFIEDYGLNAALRAYALEPQNPAYMDMLGRAQMALGQTAAAEVMFNKALSESDASNQSYIYHFHLGLLYLQTRRSAQAKTEFAQTLESDPQGPYGAQAKKLIERYFP